MHLNSNKLVKIASLSAMLAATVLLAGSALAATPRPLVHIGRPSQGAVKVTLHNVYAPSTSAVSMDRRYRADPTKPRRTDLSLTIPAGLAGRFAAAARKGLRVFTAHDGATGPQLRLVAGQGTNIVVIDRRGR